MVLSCLMFLWVLLRSIQRGDNKRSIVANFVFNILLVNLMFFIISAIDVSFEKHSDDRIEPVFQLLSRAQKSPYYRQGMPKIVLEQLDHMVKDVEAVPAIDFRSTMKERHDRVLSFYHELEQLVPANIRGMAQSCDGDLVREVGTFAPRKN